jgi:hypothetical protein
MSRAFANEDNLASDLPDWPFSEHMKYVTERDLGPIDSALEAARKGYGTAQASGDREARASKAIGIVAIG